MELSRPVVVQYHGHLTLTLDFQGQILKMLYRMLEPHCDFQLWPHPMTLTLDFQGQILKKSWLRNGMPNWHGTKGMWVAWMLDPCCDFQLWPHPWPWPWIFNVKFWNSCIPWMGGLIDMERKGYESIGCYTCYLSSSFDLYLGCSSGCGFGTFLIWCPPLTTSAGPQIFIATTGMSE